MFPEPGKEPTRWERWLAKGIGVVSIRRPPKQWIEDPIRDSLMAFHWCHHCREYRFDRHYDFLSQAERVVCAKCGFAQKTRAIGCATTLFFYLRECSRIAYQGGGPPDTEQPYSKARGRLRFVRFLFGGIPEQELPPHRNGKPTGELELSTAMFIMTMLPHIISSIPENKIRR